MSLALASAAIADDFTRVSGQHIRLTTDVAPDEAAELVASFDAAVPQWAKLLELDPKRLDDWSVNAWVMRDVNRFYNAKQIAADVPDFPYGYALNNRVYVKAQPSHYYTRHLLLHEGTHSLAIEFFGGGGPTWFMEGTAEWLGTHRGSKDDIEIGTIPGSSEEVPYWGRFTALKQLRDEERLPSIETVMRYRPNLLGEVPTYGCAWAAIRMMRAYPNYRPLILKSNTRVRKTTMVFNRLLGQDLSPEWPIFAARWRLWTEAMDYGFDPQRNLTQLSVEDPLWDGKPIKREIAADRGWQSVGVRVPAGRTVKVRANGSVTLASDPKPWLSYPDGVTIRYERGKPLGQLIGLVLPNRIPGGETLPALKRITIGESSEILIEQASWLLLRVNDAAGELGDNTGAYEVMLE